MSAPVQRTKLYEIHQKQCRVLLKALDGEPLLDGEGNPVIIAGEVFLKPPTAAVLREVREFLKDNGIDQEPMEGSGVVEVSKALEFYDDSADPLLCSPEQNQ